jgi:hypothetical protein
MVIQSLLEVLYDFLNVHNSFLLSRVDINLGQSLLSPALVLAPGIAVSREL